MSLLVFPSKSKPQFYISGNRYAITYFINNFLFSGNTRIQALINVVRLVVPPTFFQMLLKLVLNKSKKLPDKVLHSFNEAEKYIDNNSEAFRLRSAECKELDFIIRMSTWERADDKFVIILFSKLIKYPLAIVKVGTSTYKKSIQLEYDNTCIAYNQLKDKVKFTIPRPVSFHITERTSLYFEEPIMGEPVNNYLKLIRSDRNKQDLYMRILENSADFLASLNCDDTYLTPQEMKDYFIVPIDTLSASFFGNKHTQRFSTLKADAEKLKNDKIRSSWMHGDFWGGSVLYNNSGIGVIDWEFFTKRGVPLWDFFSLAFHVGVEISRKPVISSDFMNYFSNLEVARKVDKNILFLAGQSNIKTQLIPLFFQGYLLYNMLQRDTANERYWQICLEYYWSLSRSGRDVLI